VVATNAVFAPVPAPGVPVAVTGGQAAAHAAVHALVVPESAPNMYTVRPCESTRMFPSPVMPTATAGEAARAVVGAAVDGDTVDPLALLEPHAAASAMSRAAPAPARSVEVDLRLVTGDFLSVELPNAAERRVPVHDARTTRRQTPRDLVIICDDAVALACLWAVGAPARDSAFATACKGAPRVRER